MSAELREKQIWKRLRLEIRGVVQGVGFRPFVFAAAKKFDLNGFPALPLRVRRVCNAELFFASQAR